MLASEVVQIPLTIEIDGAMDSFAVPSDITWLDFRIKVANRLVKSASNLNLGYKFTTHARAKAPNRLASHVQCIEMLLEAREALAVYNAKGKKATKPFKVEIMDLDAGKTNQKGSKHGKVGKQRTVCTFHLNSCEIDIEKAVKSKMKGREANASDSDHSLSDGTGKQAKPIGQSQWVQAVERDNRCDKHHGHTCFVRNDGSHYHLTMSDKSLWGMMMVHTHFHFISNIIFEILILDTRLCINQSAPFTIANPKPQAL